MARLIKELRRRSIIRAGVTYVVASWVLLQVVDLLAPALNLPDSATRITLYALLIGFPIAMLLSWFYQITPEGIRLDEDSDSESPKSKALDFRLNVIVIALLGAAVILFAIDKWWPRHAEDPSVAVLPFVSMSALEDNEWFADGLTETILHDLAQNPNLRVAARTSVFAFKGKDEDVRQIARQLGVANVLEGSVQRAGDELRITAQLIRANDGSHLWSAQYDRKLEDVFDIQTEIAESVGSKLTETLLGIVETTLPVGISTRNTEAYDMYLQALAEIGIHSFGSLRNAEELLKSALALDPDFTDAKALLARTYVSLADTGAMDSDTGFARAASLYEQVLSDLPAHVGARAFLILKNANDAIEGGDLAARPEAVKPILELVNEAPNDVGARVIAALILRNNGMFDESIEQFQEAMKLDPLNPEPPHLLADVYVAMRQWDAAREQIEHSLRLEPNQPNTVAQLASLHEAVGNAAGFIQQIQVVMEMDPLDPEMPYENARLLYELELIEEGDQFRDRVIAIAPDSPAAQSLRIIRAIRADSEEASLEIARQLIRDDADDRRQAWIRAFRHLMLTAVLRDRTQEELEFVEEYLPYFSDWDDFSGGWKVGLGRAHTLEIWLDLEDDAGVQDRVNRTVQAFAALEMPVSNVPYVHIDVLLLQGDLEGAINSALDNFFTRPALRILPYTDRFRTPLYEEFVVDPRIATAIKKWEDELAQAREEARQYLASLEPSQ